MTEFAPVSIHYSIIVREGSIKDRGLKLDDLLSVFEVDRPQGTANGLLSFGPHQGVEVSDTLCARLEAIGLRYVEDYFVFAPDAPDWCRFGAAFTTSHD